MTPSSRRYWIVLRGERFSTAGVSEDSHVPVMVGERLKNAGWQAGMSDISGKNGSQSSQTTTLNETHIISEDELCSGSGTGIGAGSGDVILNMARGHATLNRLEMLQERGAEVINSPQSVLRCSRRDVHRVLSTCYNELLPRDNSAPAWVKAGDGMGMHAGNTTYCSTLKEAEALRQRKLRQGLVDTVIQAHIDGECCKFYGVSGGELFKLYSENKTPLSISTSTLASLRHDTDRVSRQLGVVVYGGDAVVTADGRAVIIDFNDWPSFSPCREEAAEAVFRKIASDGFRRHET